MPRRPHVSVPEMISRTKLRADHVLPTWWKSSNKLGHIAGPLQSIYVVGQRWRFRTSICCSRISSSVAETPLQRVPVMLQALCEVVSPYGIQIGPSEARVIQPRVSPMDPAKSRLQHCDDTGSFHVARTSQLSPWSIACAIEWKREVHLSHCSMKEGSESIEDLLFNIRKPSDRARCISINPVVKLEYVRVIE